MTVLIEDLNQTAGGRPILAPLAPLTNGLHKLGLDKDQVLITLYASNIGAASAYVNVLLTDTSIPSSVTILTQEIPTGETIQIMCDAAFYDITDKNLIEVQATAANSIMVYGRLLRFPAP